MHRARSQACQTDTILLAPCLALLLLGPIAVMAEPQRATAPSQPRAVQLAAEKAADRRALPEAPTGTAATSSPAARATPAGAAFAPAPTRPRAPRSAWLAPLAAVALMLVIALKRQGGRA